MSERKRQEEKKQTHEEVLSKTPKLFDLGFQHKAAAAANHKTEQTTTTLSDVKMEEALEVQVLPDYANVNATEIDAVHQKKDDQ